MRLICPRCGAQYEIDAAAIPAGGRDVECSACDHVWRAQPALDPEARPPLSRPLSESVIDILRAEAARELDARAAERAVQRAAERQARAATEGAGADDAVPGAAPGDQPEADDENDDWLSAPGPDRPDERPAAVNGTHDGAGLGAGSTDRPPEDAAALAASPAGAPVAEAIGAGTSGRVAAPDAAGPLADRAPQSVAAPAADPGARLAPDSARPLPPRPAPPIRPAPRATAASAARRRHDAGFNLAVMVALAALALYTLAPRLADQGPVGQALVAWRAQVDDGRDWLARRGDAALAWLREAAGR